MFIELKLRFSHKIALEGKKNEAPQKRNEVGSSFDSDVASLMSSIILVSTIILALPTEDCFLCLSCLYKH
jgi:hypothetical protein